MRPKGSAVELEARRRKAVALLQDGKSNTEVARLVGADLSSVKRWKRAVAAGGLTVLAAKPNRERMPKLTPAQRQELAVIVRARSLGGRLSQQLVDVPASGPGHSPAVCDRVPSRPRGQDLARPGIHAAEATAEGKRAR